MGGHAVSGCCDGHCANEGLQRRQRGVLRGVLAINAVMFGVILTAAVIGNSSALFADSFDNLGDALTYALSLYVVAGTASAKARVALIKGGLIFFAGILVCARVAYAWWVPEIPVFEVMGLFSLLALAANGLCLYLLWRHRDDDINMNSVWACSRNDIAANLSVFAAAGGVWLAQSVWPDIVIAMGLAWLLLHSGWRVSARAWREYQTAR